MTKKQKLYVDNAYNRKLGRVGKPHGNSKPHFKSKSQLKSKKEILEIEVKPYILATLKSTGYNVSINPHDKKPKANIENMTNAKVIYRWYKNRTKIFPSIFDDIKNIDVHQQGKLIKDGIKICIELHKHDKNKHIIDYDIIAEIVSDPDDDGNNPIKIEGGKKYNKKALVVGTIHKYNTLS